MPYMDLNEEKIKALGARPGSLVTALSVVRYTVGVVQRERERLAAIFQANGLEEIAAGILNTEKDDLVFKWVGPGASLDKPPTPYVEPPKESSKPK